MNFKNSLFTVLVIFFIQLVWGQVPNGEHFQRKLIDIFKLTTDSDNLEYIHTIARECQEQAEILKDEKMPKKMKNSLELLINGLQYISDEQNLDNIKTKSEELIRIINS